MHWPFQLDPVHHELWAREVVPALQPVVFEHGWDVIGIVDIKTCLLRCHPRADFIDTRCALRGWDIELGDDIRLAAQMPRDFYPRWSVGVHPVATKMRDVCFVLLVMPLLTLGILAGLLVPPGS